MGSQISGRVTWRAKYTSSTTSATAIRIVTPRCLPGKKPKATPWLRVFTSCTPGGERRSSPGTIELFDGVLGELVDDHDDQRHEPHEQPRAQHRALGAGRTISAARHRSLSRG